MTALPKHRFTEQEYLEFERGSNVRHEFYQGEVFAMSGASVRHSRIVTNMSTALDSRLRDHPCDVYTTDLQLKVEASGLYTYPDVMVVCEKSMMEGKHDDVLLNPMVIVEVLSPSTEDYDRGTKFDLYRQIDSLCDYLLVSQVQMQVEHRRRKADGGWTSRVHQKPDAAVKLKSIGCEVPLSEIYRRVTLED